jgi:hypothetical protein
VLFLKNQKRIRDSCFGYDATFAGNRPPFYPDKASDDISGH